MKTFFSQKQLMHNPQHEISDGYLRPANEVPQRAKMIVNQLIKQNFGEVLEPDCFSINRLQRIHSDEYLQFLEGFWQHWLDEGRREEEAFPFVWPRPDLRTDRVPQHLDGKLGFYSFDAGTPIMQHTWEAARKSADTALSAARCLSMGETAAFALCRPPGHHAHEAMFGGYCFLNNAAVAAQYLHDQGASRVSILDIDYHHGNGTQSIFYARKDVQFVSLHADPEQEFPYFLGYQDETGEGAGLGYNHNFPLPLGTGWEQWQRTLQQALKIIQIFSPDALVVSVGVDTFEIDPISQFKLQTQHFRPIGAQLAQLKKPTLFCMEGGYAVEEIGINLLELLQGFVENR
ncbi:histone deacetylase family protein [Polycladidibacter stylochi]|uniref:histone deacetylase family protein n=1 Tax=Polycladidibacter stylochi TaxID=1807766 RepID=UPI0008307C5D|nr:histone deacetylase family protein [Pseudovibrio stylochi]